MADRVVYLFGAGATQACIKAQKSSHSLLMRDLSLEIAEELKRQVKDKYKEHSSIEYLINDVIDETTDFEHILTFLDDSVSKPHRDFAQDLRNTFEVVLRAKLAQIQVDTGELKDDLYLALLELHELANGSEELSGILTLNYDDYVESAIKRSGKHSLDCGVVVHPIAAKLKNIRVLKLHGSFDWDESFPMKFRPDAKLWIPPGIDKSKERYPFNLLWGMARELLDCDVLRIVGVRLGANDWDLISLLFTTRHTHTGGKPYKIEIIGSPKEATRLKLDFPYLGVTSMYEDTTIGPLLISETLGGAPKQYKELSAAQLKLLEDGHGNWFRMWLRQRAEGLPEKAVVEGTALGRLLQGSN